MSFDSTWNIELAAFHFVFHQNVPFAGLLVPRPYLLRDTLFIDCAIPTCVENFNVLIFGYPCYYDMWIWYFCRRFFSRQITYNAYCLILAGKTSAPLAQKTSLKFTAFIYEHYITKVFRLMCLYGQMEKDPSRITAKISHVNTPFHKARSRYIYRVPVKIKSQVCKNIPPRLTDGFCSTHCFFRTILCLHSTPIEIKKGKRNIVCFQDSSPFGMPISPSAGLGYFFFGPGKARGGPYFVHSPAWYIPHTLHLKSLFLCNQKCGVL